VASKDELVGIPFISGVGNVHYDATFPMFTSRARPTE